MLVPFFESTEIGLKKIIKNSGYRDFYNMAYNIQKRHVITGAVLTVILVT